MDFSDYDYSELEILQDELMEEIQSLHEQMEEKRLMLEQVVEILCSYDDFC